MQSSEVKLDYQRDFLFLRPWFAASSWMVLSLCLLLFFIPSTRAFLKNSVGHEKAIYFTMLIVSLFFSFINFMVWGIRKLNERSLASLKGSAIVQWTYTQKEWLQFWEYHYHLIDNKLQDPVGSVHILTRKKYVWIKGAIILTAVVLFLHFLMNWALSFLFGVPLAAVLLIVDMDNEFLRYCRELRRARQHLKIARQRIYPCYINSHSIFINGELLCWGKWNIFLKRGKLVRAEWLETPIPHLNLHNKVTIHTKSGTLTYVEIFSIPVPQAFNRSKLQNPQFQELIKAWGLELSNST